MMRTVWFFAAIFCVCAGASAQGGRPAGDIPPTSPSFAETLPHDRHEGMTLAADAYNDAARSKAKFGKASPIPAGVLPVEVFLRNETDQPIRIDLNTVQLEVHPPESQRQDLDSMSVTEVAITIAHPGGPPDPTLRRLPRVGVSLPGKDKKTDQLTEILKPLSLDSDVVPPMGMIHGFLFFNVSGKMSLASSASLYLPDATIIPSKRALMFYEVALGEASQADSLPK